jgi:hypothetical protein
VISEQIVYYKINQKLKLPKAMIGLLFELIFSASWLTRFSKLSQSVISLINPCFKASSALIASPQSMQVEHKRKRTQISFVRPYQSEAFSLPTFDLYCVQLQRLASNKTLQI